MTRKLFLATLFVVLSMQIPCECKQRKIYYQQQPNSLSGVQDSYIKEGSMSSSANPSPGGQAYKQGLPQTIIGPNHKPSDLTAPTALPQRQVGLPTTVMGPNHKPSDLTAPAAQQRPIGLPATVMGPNHKPSDLTSVRLKRVKKVQIKPAQPAVQQLTPVYTYPAQESSGSHLDGPYGGRRGARPL